MFRGSSAAKIDDKGRLKLPTQFRRTLEEHWGSELFITSIEGDVALLYPLPVWEQHEAKLATLPASDRVKQRYLERVNYFGQETTLDTQGRLLVPQLLRERAGIDGDVMVTGYLDHLVVSNRGRLDQRIADQPFTEEDFRALSALGV